MTTSAALTTDKTSAALTTDKTSLAITTEGASTEAYVTSEDDLTHRTSNGTSEYEEATTASDFSPNSTRRAPRQRRDVHSSPPPDVTPTSNDTNATTSSNWTTDFNDTSEVPDWTTEYVTTAEPVYPRQIQCLSNDFGCLTCFRPIIPRPAYDVSVTGYIFTYDLQITLTSFLNNAYL